MSTFLAESLNTTTNYSGSLRELAVVEKTSVKLRKDVLEQLRKLKIHPRETYEDVIRRLLNEHEKKK